MEGYKITDAQVKAEYDALYRPAQTPITNPELYDPLNPPPGWEYDRWHACWYKNNVSSESLAEIRLAGIIAVGFLAGFSIYLLLA
jgi:hypothetical protein